MTFEFLYESDGDDDAGYRVIEAASMEAAIAIFKAQAIAEGALAVVSAFRGRANRQEG